MSVPEEEWLRCKPWIEEMVSASGLYDMPYIEGRIADSSLHLWAAQNSMALTEFLTFPLAKVLNVFAVGGRKGFALPELTKEVEPLLVAWGRANECTKIIGYGIKPEWKPVCEGMNYSHLWTVMVKDI